MSFNIDTFFDQNQDSFFMKHALKQAVRAYEADEVPIGAIIVHEERVIARAFNQVEMLHDATAHAEMLAITQAENALGDWRLNECDLYVTKEPCPMCAGAVVLSRLRRVIFGCHDPRGGAAGGFINLLQTPNLGHRCSVTGGVCEEECRRLLQTFFGEKRALKKNSASSDFSHL